MARGTPDARIQESTYAGQISDLAYIANMLWGFSPIDSQGRVTYLDTFNNGLGGFIYETNGGAAIPSLVNPGLSVITQVFCPPNMVKINAGVSSGDDVYIQRGMFWGINTRLGLEVALRCDTNSPNYIIRMDYMLDSTHSARCELNYNRAAGNWRIQVAGGGYQNIYGMSMAGIGNRWVQVKVVADWSTKKYMRAFIGERFFDISAYTMYNLTFSTAGDFFTSIGAASYGAGSADGYIGYVLLTKDEP